MPGSKRGSVTTEYLSQGFAMARVKGTEHDVVLAELGDPDEDDGMRVTVVPNYLLIELNIEDGGGEMWIPIMTLLEVIGNMNKITGS